MAKVIVNGEIQDTDSAFKKVLNILKHEGENKMKDVDICITQEDGREIVVNTSLLDEDVLRMRCGLEPKEQD